MAACAAASDHDMNTTAAFVIRRITLQQSLRDIVAAEGVKGKSIKVALLTNITILLIILRKTNSKRVTINDDSLSISEVHFMGGNIKVLLADDNARLRDSLANFLGLWGGMEIVGTAANGQEAVERCSELHPDVVLMDLRMPGGDGITATREIHEQYPDIQVIALTSGFLAEAEEAVAAGAAEYLFKTASVYTIIDTIKEQVAKNSSDDPAH
jgi:CheY-like chemotaxis protein